MFPPPFPAHVHDHALAADLAVVPLDELADAVRAHVGDVEVADPAAGRFFDPPPVRLDVVQIDERVLVGDRLERHLPGAFERGLAVHGELDRPVRLVEELAVGAFVLA